MSTANKCIVPGCSSESSVFNQDLKWYEFPSQTQVIPIIQKDRTVCLDQRKVWVDRLGLQDEKLSPAAVVCSLHFAEEDFVATDEGTLKMKDKAVPSKNLPPGSKSDYDFNNQTKETQNRENEIETIEKNSDDDDDDVKIIEPERETITVDDDDGDEDPLAEVANGVLPPAQGPKPITVINAQGKRFLVQPPNSMTNLRPIGVRLPNINNSPQQQVPMRILPRPVATIKKVGISRHALPLDVQQKLWGEQNKTNGVIQSPSSKSPQVASMVQGSTTQSPTAPTVACTSRLQCLNSAPTNGKSLSTLINNTRSLLHPPNALNKEQAELLQRRILKLNENNKQLTKEEMTICERMLRVPRDHSNHLGFADLYEIINKLFMNFSFEVFGVNYTLKDFNLVFEEEKTKKRSTAVITEACLKSQDIILLNGMNISLGMASDNIDKNKFSKKVTYKKEILRTPEAPKDAHEFKKESEEKKDEKPKRAYRKETEGTNDEKPKRAYNKQNKDKYIETKVVQNGESKTVIYPSADLKEKWQEGSNGASKGVKTDDLSALEWRKLKAKAMVGKRKNPKQLSSRRFNGIPESQMVPSINAGRPMKSVSRLRNRRLALQKEKSPNRSDDNVEKPAGISTPKQKSPVKNEAKPESPQKQDTNKITTRSRLKREKRDYKNLDKYGTTEEATISKTPKKKTPKRPKYSDKVGDIESFLEVVLEPETKEDMDVDDPKPEKSETEG